MAQDSWRILPAHPASEQYSLHNYLTAKKAINPLSDVEGSSCGLVDGLIYMNVRHWPITIRYDSAHLNSNPCHADAILTPDEIVFLVPNWQEHVRVIYCLGHTDSIEDRYDIEGLPAGAYVVEVISSQKNKPAYYKLIQQ